MDEKQQSAVAETQSALIERHGSGLKDRITSGVNQVARFWREEDGTAGEMRQFCLESFCASDDEHQALFDRLQKNLESLFGNFHRVARDFYWHLHVETGPMLPIDYQFAKMNVFAHISEDLFRSGVAFSTLLNFPIRSLDEMEAGGQSWSRREWAEARLAQLFRERIPAEANSKRSAAYVAADDYISRYNIHMNRIVAKDGARPFEQELSLISHWGLRDELKAQYAYGDGLERQRLIQKIMERVICQEVPGRVINAREFDWDPWQNKILDQAGTAGDNAAEEDKRYHVLQEVFRAERGIDSHTPMTPSLIQRRFNNDRELSQDEVADLFRSILSAPVVHEVADLIRRRLGRDLEPFDIWYDGFRPDDAPDEKALDQLVKQRFSDLGGLQRKLPEILETLGFTPEKARYLAGLIAIDPARGAGHASGAMLRGEAARLRTRVPPNGIDFKGFNTAMHELGHTVEQTFSLNDVDHYFLEGVPNTAFTEAFAFAFQSRDLAVLGLDERDDATRHLRLLNGFWATMEISGVAMVDMGIWNWMYDHPQAEAQEIKAAMLTIAREVWDEFFAPAFGQDGQILLAVYSHIINSGLYVPDYPLGHIISFQIEEYIRSRNLAEETERMCRLGRLAPQSWMKQAVGAEISAEPMIQACQEAVAALKSG